MTDSADEELIQTIARHLEADHQYVTRLPADQTAEIKQLRSCGRRAGRLIGRSVRTFQSPRRDGTVAVYVVLAELTEEERRRGDAQAAEAMGRILRGDIDTEDFRSVPKPEQPVAARPRRRSKGRRESGLSDEQMAELTMVLARMRDEMFDEDGDTDRPNLDMFRDLAYAEMLADHLASEDFTEVAALNLALDDVADVWGGRLEMEVLDALAVVADEWERAAATLQPGDVEALRLRLAVRQVRVVLPRLDGEAVEEEVRARAFDDDLHNVVAASALAQEEGEPAYRKFLDSQGEDAFLTIGLALGNRPDYSLTDVWIPYDDLGDG